MFVGIDVSKDTLDVFIRPNGKSFRAENNEAGIAELVSGVRGANLIVVEATGGYQWLLCTMLVDAGLPVAVVNPRQVRDFAKSLGRLAKTDRLDAEVLAHFADAVRPPVRELPDEETRELAALITRRRQIVEMITSERNRFAIAPLVLKAGIQEHIDWLRKDLKGVDNELKTLLKKSPLWRDKDKMLKSVPGVGDVVSGTLIAALPELGKLNRQKIAAIVGVAPFNHDSGEKKGKRSVWGGRANVRSALYMATLVATQRNPVIKAHYQQLRARGKEPKVALTACMRKLLVILNAMVKQNKMWEARPQHALAT